MLSALLAIPTHGAVGVWDEIVAVVAILFTLLIVAIWRLSRRFQPELDSDTLLDEQEGGPKPQI